MVLFLKKYTNLSDEAFSAAILLFSDRRRYIFIVETAIIGFSQRVINRFKEMYFVPLLVSAGGE